MWPSLVMQMPARRSLPVLIAMVALGPAVAGGTALLLTLLGLSIRMFSIAPVVRRMRCTVPLSRRV
ncbi:hypothetical protein D3C72_929240 [compost metagenome]